MKKSSFLVVSFMFVFMFSLTILQVNAEPIRYFYDNQWHEYNNPPIELLVNGKIPEMDMPPINFNGRTVVPARAVFESFGAKITWDEKNSQVGIFLNDVEILLTIDDTVAAVNGKPYKMDIAPKIINSRTMIPTRFVAETLGLDVGWDPTKNRITIDYPTSKDNHVNLPNSKELNINNIQYIIEDSILRVIITADSIIEEYSHFKLDNHPRLVIDIKNAVFNTNKELKITNDIVVSVRSSQYQNDPKIVRSVVDLNQWLPFNISTSNNKKHLYIDFALTNETQDLYDEEHIISDEDTIKYSRLVVIDPGHGGSEIGASYDGLKEKDANLDIALRLYDLLKESGINVKMTRMDDSEVGLKERAYIANELDATLFVSIHNNSYIDPKVHGTETFYFPGDRSLERYGITSKRLAQLVQNELIEKLETYNRGIKDGSNLAVIRHTKMPAILVEVAFGSNPDDLQKLKDDSFKQKAAQALHDGIIRALNESIGEQKIDGVVQKMETNESINESIQEKKQTDQASQEEREADEAIQVEETDREKEEL